MSTRTALAQAFYDIGQVSLNSGVTGINGATGGVSLTSADSSVTITADVGAKTVNLSVTSSSFPVKSTVYLAGPAGWEGPLDTAIGDAITNKTRALIMIQPDSNIVYKSTVFDVVLYNAPFFAYSIMNFAAPSSGFTLELRSSPNVPIVTISPGEIVTLMAKGGIAGGVWNYLPGVVLATDLVL